MSDQMHRQLTLTRMALTLSLKILDAMTEEYPDDEIDGVLEQAESDMDDLKLLRAELDNARG